MAKSRRVRSRRGKGTKHRRGGQFDAAMMAVPAMLARPVYNLGKSSASSAYNGAKGLASSAYGSASLASQKAREKANGMYSSMFGKSSPPPPAAQPGMGGRRTRRRRRH
uniref:Uncharacterized protein n=1 Tax=viral metagenome TaxID=1070528 RepID=A0A6C0D825_9ZZZZ